MFHKHKSSYNTQNLRAPMVFINENIKAPNITIIDETWTNIWTYPRRNALEMAAEKWLDLIQIRYEADTMTSLVKLADYGKYAYQKQKDDKQKRKTQKPRIMKEMKLSYGIWDNDLMLKIKKATEMLQEWFNVKFLIRLKWREKIYAVKAIEKLMKIKTDLATVWKPQTETAKQEMQWYSIVLFSKS